MASVQRKEIKSSNVLGETLQDTTDTFTGSVRKFIYFGNVTTVRHEASPRYCNMSLHQDGSYK